MAAEESSLDHRCALPASRRRYVLLACMMAQFMAAVESTRAALSWLRTHAKEYGIDPDFFAKAEMHVHVPSGAIPKDGPSAGVTMATAMASILTGRPVRGDLAMTGEITLSGRVLPIGGVKEKVLAAHRAGIRTVILPAANELDADDIPDDVRSQLTLHFVDDIAKVLELALEH